jgi:excisionase family DNA binding protein
MLSTLDSKKEMHLNSTRCIFFTFHTFRENSAVDPIRRQSDIVEIACLTIAEILGILGLVGFRKHDRLSISAASRSTTLLEESEMSGKEFRMRLDLLDTNDTLLTTASVADRLGISVRTLAKLFAANEIARVKVGGRVFVKQSDLDQYLSRPQITWQRGKNESYCSSDNADGHYMWLGRRHDLSGVYDISIVTGLFESKWVSEAPDLFSAKIAASKYLLENQKVGA